ncbi:MAG: hypothetical protein WB696_29430 [Chthoniobacterales bacterium]
MSYSIVLGLALELAAQKHAFRHHGRIHMFMRNKNPLLRLALSSAVVLSSLATLSPAIADQGTFLPSGVTITPTAAPKTTYEALNPELAEFPNFIAGGALSAAKSPDGKILLVLTGGHNNLKAMRLLFFRAIYQVSPVESILPKTGKRWWLPTTIMSQSRSSTRLPAQL